MRPLFVCALFLLACAHDPKPDPNALHLTAITAGFGFTCALNTDHAATCWGANQYGQLGVNDSTTACMVDNVARGRCVAKPVVVTGDTKFESIDAGEAHVCALTTEGQAFCWGDNSSGQLGSIDSTHTCEVDYYKQRGYGATACATVPRAVATDLRFTSIAAASGFTCALTREGEAYCWGHWTNNRMGGSPEAIANGGFAKFNAAEPFAQITADGSRVCALTRAGRIYCWGEGVAAPSLVASDAHFTNVSRGWRHTCAVADNGAAYCWGENDSGQLGNGQVNAKFNSGDTTIFRVARNIKFKSVDAGFVSTCGIATNGDQYCWGDGATIDATVTDQCKHVNMTTPCALRPVKTSLRDVTVMSSGLSHRCAIRRGNAYCWGDNLSFAVSSQDVERVLQPVIVTR